MPILLAGVAGVVIGFWAGDGTKGVGNMALAAAGAFIAYSMIKK